VSSPFLNRIADLIRHLGTENDNEIVVTVRALKRRLESKQKNFSDLGNAIVDMENGGLAQKAMERIRDAAYAKGLADAKRAQIEGQVVYGLKPDGSPDWLAIALYCQRQKNRIEPNSYKFIDDMCSRLSWEGREPIGKQGPYLLSIFRGIGGKIK
jgi:hypothetical protein